MKRALFKVILPALAIGIWILTCYPVCNKAEGFDFFLFWILVGFPFGIRKMCMVLIPKNFGISGSMGVLALKCCCWWFNWRCGADYKGFRYGS